MKIKFVSNFADSNSLKQRVLIDSIDEDNFNPRLEITDDSDYDYMIILNGSPEMYKSPKEKNIAFIMEPSWSTNYYRDLPDHCFKVFTHRPEIFGSKINKYIGRSPRAKILTAKIFGVLPNVIYHPTFNFLNDSHPKSGSLSREIFKGDNNFEKLKKLSIIISNIYSLDKSKNYYKRHHLIKKILQSNLQIDIFGIGWKISDPRYKGAAPDKRTALKDYEYSIVIQNCNERGYLPDPISECLCNNTVPIYHGCSNIDEIYHPKSFIKFDPMRKTAIEELKHIVNQPNQIFKEFVLESKRRYLEEYNLYNFLKKLLLH